MGELLSDYGCGLKALKESQKHNELEHKIKALQRKLPSMKISSRVNEYFVLSDGYYNLAISTNP